MAEDATAVAAAGGMTLTGIKVLDLASRGSGAWCTRLLGDYGADVIAVETATGHSIRRDPPFDSQNMSIAARYLLANKRFASLDEANRLAVDAHVIVTDALPGQRFDTASLQALNPQALICALTPYGQFGERAQLPASELTVAALSGWAGVNGHQGRTPLKPSRYQVTYQAGTFAFGCVVCALIEQLASEEGGQILDIAELEVLVSTFSPAPLRYQYSGFVWPRKQRLDVNDGPVEVADGFFALTISRPAFWIKAMRILGLPDLADDEELQQAGLRPKLKERFVGRMSEAMSRWTRMDLFDALAAERVIAGPVLRMDELAENPQLQAREFFRSTPSGARFPGPFAQMGRSAWAVRHEPVDCDESVAAFETTSPLSVQPVRAGGRGLGPLNGFRALVLTQAWAGTYATELLGLLGAEVIQLEVRKRLDSWRGTYQNPIPRGLKDLASAEHSWNVSPLYNSVNLNKQCITVDLDTEEGVILFKRLVAKVDFVAENFSPRVMGKLGIDYEALCAIKPDLVMASLSAYGAVGPWANVPGIGGTIEPSSGMSALLGYEGEEPLNSGQMYPDPVAGLCGFSAIALALLHRDRTGEGQFIDLSMQEANFTFIGDAWLEYELTGQVRGPEGNRHPRLAPHGIYPAAGDDQWVAISVDEDDQWQRLVQLLELDLEMAMNETERFQQRVLLDERIGAATRKLNKQVLATQLCDQGIAAAPVQSAAEVTEDAHLKDRGHVVRVIHPEAGNHWQSGLPALLSRTPGGVTAAAPLQGQHSWSVFSRLLDMDEVEYQRLVDAEISGRGGVAGSTVANQA